MREKNSLEWHSYGDVTLLHICANSHVAQGCMRNLCTIPLNLLRTSICSNKVPFPSSQYHLTYSLSNCFHCFLPIDQQPSCQPALMGLQLLSRVHSQRQTFSTIFFNRELKVDQVRRHVPSVPTQEEEAGRPVLHRIPC